MPKMKALIRIENEDTKEEIKTTAIMQDNRLLYKDNHQATMTIDYKEPRIIRETKELKITYPFKNNKKTIGMIEIKDTNQVLNIEIQTKKIKRNNNDIEIKYIIENKQFIYQVEEIK